METDVRNEIMKLKECLVMLEEQIDALETQKFEAYDLIKESRKEIQSITQQNGLNNSEIYKKIDQGIMELNNLVNLQENGLRDIVRLENDILKTRVVAMTLGALLASTLTLLCAHFLFYP